MAAYISTNQGLLKTASVTDADWINVPLRPGDPAQSANSVGALQWRDSRLYALGAGGVYEVDDDLFCAAPNAQTLDVGALGFVSDVGTRMSYIAAGGALVSVEDSTTSLPTLPDGTHSLTAYAVDFAGNQSAESTPAIVTIDTTAPETTVTVFAPDGRFGWYRTAPPISLVATDNVVGVASTSYSWDSTDTAQPYEGPVTAPEGVHVLCAASVDATGNAEAPMPFEFRVDTTAPTVSVSSPAPDASLLSPTLLSGSASDANLYAWKVMLGRGSAPSSFVTLASDEGTSVGQPAAFIDPIHYASGDYTLRIEGTDEAGNASVADLPVRIDTPTSARWESRAIENDHVRLEFDDSGTVTSWKVDLNASGSPSDDFSLLCGDTASAGGIGVVLGLDPDSLQRALAEGGTVSFEPYATSTHAGQRITLELPGQGLTITEDYSLSPHSTWPTVDIEVERTGDASATGLSYGPWMCQVPEAEADDLSLLAKAAGDALEPSALATGTVQAGTSWGALLSDAPAFAAGVVTEGDTPVSISATVSAEPFDRAVGTLLVPDLSELASGEPVTSRLALVAGKDTTFFDEAAYVLSSSFAPPSVSSLSSSFVSPGTPVTINGMHFGDTQGLGYVTFAGVEATVTAWTDTAVTVLVPEGVTVGYAGVWRTGVCSNGVYFVTGTPPRLDALSTEAALPGSEVTLTGVDFGTVTGTVTFAGVAADIVSWSDTSVTAVVPAGAPAGYVGAWRDGICSNGRFFTPSARPSIADVDPMFASAGSSVTVEGTGFGAAPGQVTLAGVTCDVLSWDETAVVFRVPEGAASGYVGVWSNGVCSNGVWFGVTE